MAGLEETGIARRSLLKRTLGLALGLFALPAVLLLRDLGPLPRKTLDTTLWKAGSLLLNAETGQSGSARRPRDRLVHDGLAGQGRRHERRGSVEGAGVVDSA